MVDLIRSLTLVFEQLSRFGVRCARVLHSSFMSRMFVGQCYFRNSDAGYLEGSRIQTPPIPEVTGVQPTRQGLRRASSESRPGRPCCARRYMSAAGADHHRRDGALLDREKGKKALLSGAWRHGCGHTMFQLERSCRWREGSCGGARGGTGIERRLSVSKTLVRTSASGAIASSPIGLELCAPEAERSSQPELHESAAFALESRRRGTNSLSRIACEAPAATIATVTPPRPRVQTPTMKAVLTALATKPALRSHITRTNQLRLLSSSAPRRQHAVPELRDKSLFKQQSYINGKWVGARSGKTFEVHDPATHQKIGVMPEMDAHDTNDAIKAASDALKTFRKTTARQRAVILRKWYDLMTENAEDLAKLITVCA